MGKGSEWVIHSRKKIKMVNKYMNSYSFSKNERNGNQNMRSFFIYCIGQMWLKRKIIFHE